MNDDNIISNITAAAANYVLVINSDISFYPGVLKKISNNMERCISHVDDFGKIYYIYLILIIKQSLNNNYYIK
jgi:hypothetical protein